MLPQAQQRLTPNKRGVIPKEPKKTPRGEDIQKPPEKMAIGGVGTGHCEEARGPRKTASDDHPSANCVHRDTETREARNGSGRNPDTGPCEVEQWGTKSKGTGEREQHRRRDRSPGLSNSETGPTRETKGSAEREKRQRGKEGGNSSKVVCAVTS